MIPAVLITNNTTAGHPAWKWAAVTAQQLVGAIVHIDPASESANAREARRLLPPLENDIADALESHYNEQINHERSMLKGLGHDRLDAAFVPHSTHHSNAVSAVLAVFQKPAYAMFKDHFSKAEVRDFVHREVGGHMCSQQHVERLAHCDRHIDDEQPRAYRLRHTDAGFVPQTDGETSAQEG